MFKDYLKLKKYQFKGEKMKIEVVMPKMGESLQEGTITKWLKKVGDKIERDEMILEISTDKVDTEVPAPNSGILAEILIPEGQTVEVGTVIAYIETDSNAKIDNSSVSNKVEIPTNNQIIETKTVNQEKSSKISDIVIQNTSSNTIDVVMPKMGESLQEGTITKWLKKVGDKVERDEMILEISTDKVDTEVPAPQEGILSEIIVKEGETVEVGTVIAKISTGSNTQTKTLESTLNEVETKSAPTEEVKNTSITQEIKESPITNITSGTKEIPSKYEGKFFSPVVRSIAEENGIFLEELMQINGSGADGRINKQDILNYIENKKKTQTQSIQKTVEIPKPVAQPSVQQTPTTQVQQVPSIKSPTISIPSTDDVEIIPMDRIRQLIAEHMIYSKHTSAHVTSVSEADVTNIVNYRNKYKDEFEKREGFKLTFTPFFAKAVIDAVRQYPMVNVSVDGKNIIRHKRINLSFATALPDGNLIVPVIKGSDMLNLTGIARAIYDLSTRARNKKLNPDDIQGGTVTLTNVGTFGTLFGTPVINQPQVAIFGVGAIKKRPVVKEIEGNDLILVRHMMYVSITYDHRVIDGMLAGQTLSAVVKAIESMNESNIVL
jgi:2-oxoglutarate dehydrogenase E2 component (dihydrolipoamide succinyltransferase)